MTLHEIDNDVEDYPEAGHSLRYDHPLSEAQLREIISARLART